MANHSCTICSKLRPLNSHIHEVSILAHFYFHNCEITYSISEWLKLSFTLDKVSVEPWDYSANDMFTCRPAYEKLVSDRINISEYTTHFTRFFFVTNALEETYRLIVSNYNSEMNSTSKRSLTSNTVKAIMLLEKIEDVYIPSYLEHYCESLSNFQDLYIKEFKPRKDSIGLEYEKNHRCKGLDIIRQLRNYISHGIFPINMNHEFNGGFRLVGNLMRFLMMATRLALVYIQIFLLKYGGGFKKDLYLDAIGYTSWIEDLNDNREGEGLPLHNYLEFVPDFTDMVLNLPFENEFGFNKFWDIKAGRT